MTTTTRPTTTPVANWDWPSLTTSLTQQGYATTPPVLTPADCADLIARYDQPEPWRSTVDMARYRFGAGQYKYFNHPLPDQVTALREACYPHLAPVANTWHEQLRQPQRFPDHLADYLTTCHEAGQTKPTPLVLRYTPGDYNCLHQDIYGDHAFPLQLMVMLSRKDKDYTGGEFVLVENLPRAQSRGRVITLQQGQAVIWPTQYRPGLGTRGHYRIAVRHGVSTVHTGHRHTLGIIFHDAR
ncbi:MAG TPA: 2OG-Fe(II) oxygenase [Pseudonocardiaceae bacterium]|nr:2OG-Fe(II) oxygenase [Pseudonocardiaceae bacterium]